jgi:hypothetical protein
MSLSKIASLAVGLLGLFVIVNALPLIQSLAWALLPKSITGVETTHEASYQQYLLVMVLSTLGFGIILIFFRQSLGNFLLGKEVLEAEKHVSAYYYHSAAISVVGIYFIVHGAADFLGTLLPRLFTGNSNFRLGFAWSGGIEFILGCCLFLGSSLLVFFWNKIKKELVRK